MCTCRVIYVNLYDFFSILLNADFLWVQMVYVLSVYNKKEKYHRITVCVLFPFLSRSIAIVKCNVKENLVIRSLNI